MIHYVDLYNEKKKIFQIYSVLEYTTLLVFQVLDVQASTLWFRYKLYSPISFLYLHYIVKYKNHHGLLILFQKKQPQKY